MRKSLNYKFTLLLVLAVGAFVLSRVTAEVVAKSGYPYTETGVDPWGFYKLQCTSYAAWAVNDDDVEMSNTMVGPNGEEGRFGSGGNWDDNASDIGYIADDDPEVNDIGVLDPYSGGAGSSGHVVYVESVNENDTVNISEYNWGDAVESYNTRDDVTMDHYIHFNECIPPETGDWTINYDCIVRNERSVPGNMLIQNAATVTVQVDLEDSLTGMLNIDFNSHKLEVKDGSGLLVKNGAKVY